MARVTERGTSRLSLAALRGAAAAVGLLLAAHASPADDGFVRGCAAECEPGWRKGATDPSSPAYGMSEKSIQGLCRCRCEAMAKDMPPALVEAARDAQRSGTPLAADLQRQVAGFAFPAMAACLPQFQKSDVTLVGFVRSCADECAAKWRKRAADPSNQVRMSERSIEDFCACHCESTADGLTPQQLKAMRQGQITGRPPPDEVTKKADELSKKANALCGPKLLDPAKPAK